VLDPSCPQRGGVEADLTVTKVGEEEWYLVTGGATKTRDVRTILHGLEEGGFTLTTAAPDDVSKGGVRLADVSADYSLLSVQGPLSHTILKPLVSCGGLDDLASFPFSTARLVEIAGVPGVRCLRLTFVGELGFELHVPSSAGDAV
jgi:sarcosine dehydrogenase